jgi:nucleoside 2-deoxyribosyltransferase
VSSNSTNKPFAVYVASSAAPGDVDRVRAAIATLRAQGFDVTCTWPEIVAMVGNANPRDADHLSRRQWSVQDLVEIDAADAVLFLVPLPPATTRGAWFESGYAYSEKKHLVFAGDTKQSIFCALGPEFEADAAAIAHLHELRVRRGLAELARNAPHSDEWPNLFDVGGEAG